MPPVQKAALAMLPKLAPTHVPRLYPEFIHSIVRLLRPDHVIEQWKEQQHGADDQAAETQQQVTTSAEPINGQVAGLALNAASLANGSISPANSGTIKQPPGQVAQAKFALTSAFLEKVGHCMPWQKDVGAPVSALSLAGCDCCIAQIFVCCAGH